MPVPEPCRLDEMRDRIQHLAYHDSLTGLPNRLLLEDRLSVALSRTARTGRLVAVLFLDLDGFKQINDRLGHALGDFFLREVAARLQQLMRSGDTLARLGGDEFVVILSDLHRLEDVVRVASKILGAIRAPFLLKGHELSITTSIGVSLAPNDAVDGEVLIRNADVAMYRAKEKGRDTFELFTPALNARAADRRALELGFERALSGGELTLAFQPIVDLATREASAVEALARWSGRKGGAVPPSEFISVAEDMGLIAALGRWAMRAACRDVMSWRGRDGSGLGVSVNVSAHQLRHAGFVAEVARVLSETGFSPSRLCLDIADGGASERVKGRLATLAGLKDLGVAIAIDDFGTGGSSLEVLRRFPFDAFKIPSSFVAGVPGNGRDAAIVKSAILLGHALGARVVAKGVETADQLEFLRRHGCDAVQGYLLGAPAPPHVLAPEFLGGDAAK